MQQCNDFFTQCNASLGKVTYEEAIVALDLFFLVLAWCTASPLGSFPGWKSSISKDLNSGAIGLAFTLPLFLLPCGRRLPSCLQKLIGEERCRSECNGETPPSCVLDWHAVKDCVQVGDSVCFWRRILSCRRNRGLRSSTIHG